MGGCVMRTRHFLVLQHLDCEHPGFFAELMRNDGITWDTVDFSVEARFPDVTAYDALLIFGGPMNVDDTDAYPWLTGEVALIKDALQTRIPILGLCLGAQLIAKALGAAVYVAETAEVGVMDVTLTPAGASDTLFGDLTSTFTVFQWHGDTFDLPSGATLLASSDACVNQAFQFENAYGLQFHLELTMDMAAAWAAIPAYIASAQQSRGPSALADLDAELTAGFPAIRVTCSHVFSNFLKSVVDPRVAVLPTV